MSAVNQHLDDIPLPQSGTVGGGCGSSAFTLSSIWMKTRGSQEKKWFCF